VFLLNNNHQSGQSAQEVWLDIQKNKPLKKNLELSIMIMALSCSKKSVSVVSKKLKC
jgi:hypothetical protein